MTTSKKDASKAGKLLQDPKVSKPVKSVAGSDVSQANSKLVLRRGFWRRSPPGASHCWCRRSDGRLRVCRSAALRSSRVSTESAHVLASTSLCSCSLRASMSCS